MQDREPQAAMALQTAMIKDLCLTCADTLALHAAKAVHDRAAAPGGAFD